MYFAFILVVLGCFQHVDSGTTDSWMTAHEPIRFLNANKVKYFSRGTPVLHDETDYTLIPGSFSWNAITKFKNVEQNPSGDLNDTIRMMMRELQWHITGQGSTATLNGEIENRSEDSRYNYYSLRRKCGDKIPVETHFEEYMGDESNQVNIWVINEMSDKMDVTFTAENEESSSTVNVNTRESSSSLTTTFGVSAFGQSASVSMGMEFGSSETFKHTDQRTEKKSAAYNLTVVSQEAIKFMRYMKMQKVKQRSEVHCYLDGYVGLQLNGDFKGQRRWFVPITELAKVYPSFTVDDTKPNTVVFKFPQYEVSSGSIHVQRTLGFKVKDLGQEFLAV